jgi:glycosyltransferase involved in cell wall biosynthesis
MLRLAYIVTHPIQYQAPLLRLIAASPEIDLRVFFLSDFSLHAHREEAFNQTFKWDTPLTEGYKWEVLPRWFIGHSTSIRSRWPVAGLKRRFKEGRFDAVWVHGWGHVGLRQAIRAASQLRLPLLLRGETQPDSSRATGLKRRLRDLYCRRLVAQTSACLCIGSLNRDFYRQFGAPDEKLFHVPYAVDNAWFEARCRDDSTRREALRSELGLLPGRPVILFAAKFIPVKAPGDLLEAYQRAWCGERRAAPQPSSGQLLPNAEKEHTKPYLLFVGDGPLRAQLEAQAGELNGNDVRFLGFRNQTELPALYDLCDLFVLPSVHEPWGLVVNEVMNANKPVIVSDRVGAAPDLVKPGVNGWIFPHGDAAALSRCLADAFHASNLSEMGRRSLEIINGWGFEADLRGLTMALEAVRRNQRRQSQIAGMSAKPV